MNAPASTSTARLGLLEKLFTGVALTGALSVAMQGFGTVVHSHEVPTFPSTNGTGAIAAPTATAKPLQDGIYLYGQTATPAQIGSAYMVFEVNQNQVVGAFYMPHSAFDCFHGTLKADQLALTVKDSYAQTSHPYAIAVQTNTTAAAANPAAIAGLAGFHPIATPSHNDHRLLSTCKANYRAGL